MPQRPIPQPTGELASNVSQILGEAGEAWLHDLPTLMSQLSAKWNLQIGDPFPAGEFNFVAAAIRGDAGPAVLKIAPPYPDNEAYSEAAYLRQRDGRFCVRLLAHDRSRRALLLERALPGENLAELYSSQAPAMVEPGIQVLRSIEGDRPPVGDSDVLVLDRWFAGLEKAAGTSFSHEHARRALNLYSTLKDERSPSYIHGDFHPGNIVAASREDFLVIDPKGVIGHVGYDIVVFLNNLLYIHPVKTDLHRAAARFATAFGLDEKAVREWAFAGYVLGKWWSYTDMHGSYVDELGMAAIWED